MRFTRWDQSCAFGETNSFCFALSELCVSRIVDTHLRLRFTDYIASSAIMEIIDYELDYAAHTPWDCAQVRQVQALFSKRADLPTGTPEERELRAFTSFVAAERLCEETNVILRAVRSGSFALLPGVESKIFFIRRKISQILGDVPDLHMIDPRFGPGATTSIPKRIASARRKLGTSFACSEELLPIIRDVLEELQNWIPFGDADSCTVPVEVHRGKLVFVPKTFKTHRTVVVEPVLNSFYQCGIGDYMAARLRKYGVDIRDQAPNQRMACEGSLSNELATLDLSSASDTVAYELIYDLLPVEWALFLKQFVTRIVEYKGHSLRLQKFSSMGNGFTFPLETLIFYAIALSCVDDKDVSLVRAYGDDIIVPCYAFDSLVETLRCLGFVPNRLKSFADGPFRESCGADYHSGINVRPCYLKEGLHGHDVFRFHNFFVRNGDFEAASLCLSFLDPTLIRYGPDGYGDGHLIGDYQSTPSKRARGFAGSTFETFTYLSKRDFRVTGGERVLPSYSIYLSQLENHDPGAQYVKTDRMPLGRFLINEWLIRKVARDIAKRKLSDVANYVVRGLSLIHI